MLSWIAARWRMLVAGSAVVLLVVSVGLWAAFDLTNSAREEAVDCSSLEAATFGEASALAGACDADVEVLADRTPWHTSWATSNNQARLDVAAVPTRVEVDGEWVPLDSSLAIDPASGALEAAAPVFPMTLNAGGDAGRGKPLGTIVRDGKQLEVWFPLDLPVAVFSDSQAVYELGDGIRLFVSVNFDGTGFLPVVELADAAAASRFTELLEAARAERGGVSEGGDLEFTTVLSEGLSLTLDDAGAVHAVDSAGETHFIAPPPSMWDSSGEEIEVRESATESGMTDRTQSPAGGDRIALMGVEIAGNTIVVSPDDAMFESADTVWPVYIDPTFSGLTSSWRVAARSSNYSGFNNTLHNWVNATSTMAGQGTGYCNQVDSCNAVFYQRLAWQFSGLSAISAMAGSDITSAQFSAYGIHSYNCTPQTTTLWRTSTVSASTTWGTLHWSDALGTNTSSQRSSCGTMGWKEFSATDGVRWAADNNQSSLSLGLLTNESTMAGWKRFRYDATLTINYNRPPDTPTSLQLTNPSVAACTTGSGRPLIATTTPTLSAVSTDPDLTNVQTAFTVVTASNPADVKWSSGNLAGMETGSRQSATVPPGLLVDGGVYAWQARAFDGALYSGWSPPCEFAVDASSPVAPSISPVTSGVQAIYTEGAERGGVGQRGDFTIDPGTSTDVVAFDYGVNDPTLSSSVIPGADGTATITFTPSVAGPVTLSVKSRDAAGNASAPTTYTFSVANPTEDGIWTLDEGTGTTAADSVGTPARPLTLTGAEWGEGPHSLFDSRAGDHALVLDGVDDFAATDAVVVDTTKSFVVSAHVWLDPARVGQGQSFTALSQDGVTESGFRLEYDDTCAGMPSGCWSFMMPDLESSGGATAVQSSVPVTGGEWTYLVGEHDPGEGMRLWVCEVGTPSDPAIGEPVKSEALRPATPWAASGAFAIGRSLTAGSHSGWWPGAIDNVRVFSGEVLAESKIRRLCQGAEATDFDGGEVALDPTTLVAE